MSEKLSTATEPQNHHDKYAVKVLKKNKVVGHVPRDIYLRTFPWGTIKCEITGKRQNNRGNGLEVPCKYIVKRPFHMVLNVEKIIKDYLSRTAK